MPNIKSAKKRVLVNEKKKAQNKMIKTGVKTAVKTAIISSEGADEKAKQVALNNAFSSIDKAANKKVLHKNTAARRKAAVAKAIYKKEQA